MALINIIVEGLLDEAMAIRLINESGHTFGTCHGKKGASYLQKKLAAFNESADNIRYLAMVDFMDTRLACPGEVVTRWLPHRKPGMLFRVVVRELESWLLADRANLPEFLRIDRAKIQKKPEELPDPKQTLVNLARSSRSRKIREALVPETGSTAAVGKLYNDELIRFIVQQWSVEEACRHSISLTKCFQRLKSLD
ncbi:MAG: hypothetical protein ACKVX9_18255 [Blastocatellia bacterium]